jgi:hypothetical protein
MTKASQIAITSSRNIERSFNIMGAAITAATGSAVGALALLIDKTEETVFQMQKMAQQAGVSMESFSKMAYAAKTAGMPVDQMAVILTRISHSSFEAASGNKQAAAAYKELGVSVTDANGHFKTADQIAVELAKSLDGYKDSAAKTGIETMIMGRSGAQAAEFLSVLANRFDEVSETAQKLGVVFTQQTAAGAQKLHDSLVMLEEAGLGLSVRLLSQVSPALDKLAEKIVDVMSNADSMKKVDDIGKELADGITVAGDALEFLINHLDQVKVVIEGLAAIRIAGLFGPMLASAAGTSDVMAKLGIASLNLTGNLLGIRRLGNVLGPVAASAKGYSVALGSLAATEGVAAAGSLALGDALATVRGLMATLAAAVPIATAAAGAVYEFGLALKGVHGYNTLKGDTGASWWQIQKAEADEATSSVKNFLTFLDQAFTGSNSASEDFYGGVAQRLGAKNPFGLSAPKAPGLPADYFTNPAMTGSTTGKKDLPALPQDAKPDELAKKLSDLKEKAEAAQRALSLVGTSPQLQQDSQILEQYNTFLADEKFRLDQLTPSKRAAAEAAARESIATIVNTDAAVKYRTALYDLSQASASSIQEHLAMAAAVGKSAQAMQDAAVAAQVNQEFNKFGPNWRDDPNKAADAQKRAAEIRKTINTDNLEADNKTASSSQQQLDAQQRLNAAILQGAEARRQAAIASAQASVKADFANRKDTDADAMQQQLDAIVKISDAEKKAADLERAASMDASLRYQEQTKAIQDAVTAAQAYGQAINFTTVLAADKEAWEQFNQAQDKATLAVGGMMDGLKIALQQMARDTVSAAQVMRDSFMQVVTTMNDAIANIVTQHHQRGSHFVSQQFSGAFRGVSDSLMKTGLQKAEGSMLKGFGLGKPDGSQSNPWYVRLVSGVSNYGANAAGVGGNELTQLMNSSSANAAGNAVGSAAGMAAKILLPMFADGTDSLVPGMPAIVGEKGPEVFIPPSSGAIVPNSKLKNMTGDQHFHIDARGATDPAHTVALIDQYMQKAAPQIAASTMRAMHENKLRSAGSGRG